MCVPLTNILRPHYSTQSLLILERHLNRARVPNNLSCVIILVCCGTIDFVPSILSSAIATLRVSRSSTYTKAPHYIVLYKTYIPATSDRRQIAQKKSQLRHNTLGGIRRRMRAKGNAT